MLSLLIFIIIAGLLLWLASLLPIDAQIYGILRIVALVLIVLAIINTLLGYAGYSFPLK